LVILLVISALGNNGLHSEPALTAAVSVYSTAQDAIVKDSSSDNPNGLNPNPWVWNNPPSAGNLTDGNWGLEAIRVPQMWNLNDAVKRTGNKILIAILDAGFEDRDSDGLDDHPDLRNLKTVIFDNGAFAAGAVTNSHGQHVAGIIGATFNNGLGIDGINPFAQMIGVSPRLKTGQSWQESWDLLIGTLEHLLRVYPDIRVVNVSMSYNWPINTQLKVNPNTDKEAQRLVERQGLRMRRLAAEFPDVLFVAAAGNDSPKRFNYPNEILAMWASPLNWAALGPDVEIEVQVFKKAQNILVIESIDAILDGERNHRKSDFSNVGGHISAPGGRILSTVLKEKYDTFDGTSMATPHVTGLVSYLLAFDPSLTVAEIKALLFKNSLPVDDESAGGRGPNGEGPAPRIDAFATALAIDTIRPGHPVQRALVDVDDCTPDGNQRINESGEDFQGFCADGLRGDGNIDMKDFRAFRDALLYVEGKYRQNLDGSAKHPKKDLNGDGCVHEADPKSCPYEEDLYPRFDFNGDGKLSRSDAVVFKGIPKTDLQVLMEMWGLGPDPDTEGWRAEELPKLLDSADLHLDLASWIAALGLDEVRVFISNAPSRVLTSRTSKLVVTVPAFMTVQIEAQGIKHGTVITKSCAQLEPLEAGQDVKVEFKDCL